MALDIKKMIADSFLELCEKKPNHGKGYIGKNGAE